MAPSEDGARGAADETEAPDHEHSHRRDLERRSTGRIDRDVPDVDASPGDEPEGRVHRLHGGGDRMGGGDDSRVARPVPVPTQGSFRQITHELTVRQSPWLPPDELAAYHAIDPDFAKGIISTVQSAQQARIDAELIPIKAESWSLRVAAFAVAFLPWVAAGIAVVFAFKGMDTAALISGLFSAFSGGAQVISAIRRPPPQVVTQRAEPAASPAATKPKPSQANKRKQVPSKSPSKRKKKKRR